MDLVAVEGLGHTCGDDVSFVSSRICVVRVQTLLDIPEV